MTPAGKEGVFAAEMTSSRTEQRRIAEADSTDWLPSKAGELLLETVPTTNRPIGRRLQATDPVGELVITAQSTHLHSEFESELHPHDQWVALLDRWIAQPGHAAVGWIGYEAMVSLSGITSIRQSTDLPMAHLYLYRHVQWEPSHGRRWSHPESPCPAKPTIVAQPERNWHAGACQKLLAHIAEGDIYQANLTAPFLIDAPVPPEEAYRRLRAHNPSPYAAFLRFGQYDILSASPELLLDWRAGRLISRPIKGTIAAAADPLADAKRIEQLRASEKEQAELLMITDMVRNDLGRVALPGTVTTDLPFAVESYRQLHHLVSTVAARVPAELSLRTLLTAVCPGGSISGAPKRRAIELLAEIETTPREFYTGSIGLFSRDETILNIAIRTLLHRSGRYRLNAGGGIVADSSPEREWEELLLKARSVASPLGAVL